MDKPVPFYPTNYYGLPKLERQFNLAKAVAVFDAMNCRVKKAEFLEEKGEMHFEVSWANTQETSTVVVKNLTENPLAKVNWPIFWVAAWEEVTPHEYCPTGKGNHAEDSTVAGALAQIITIWDRG